MLANFHTHSTFCDGKNSIEEVVLSAIEKDFDVIGFSSHGYTDFDLTYCMKDVDGYISEVSRMKEKYKDKIEIYLGVEEDAFCHTDRKRYDYIIGSSHYFNINGKYYPVDSNFEVFKKFLELFNGDAVKLADNYYSNFCNYLLKRKPDIIGHFDLLTKFEEVEPSGFLGNKEYEELALKYTKIALQSGSIFEVNTGAISRGLRSTCYPSESILREIRVNDGKVMLSSDCHEKSTLDWAFEETKKYLKDIGFQYTYILHNNEFVKDFI